MKKKPEITVWRWRRGYLDRTGWVFNRHGFRQHVNEQGVKSGWCLRFTVRDLLMYSNKCARQPACVAVKQESSLLLAKHCSCSVQEAKRPMYSTHTCLQLRIVTLYYATLLKQWRNSSLRIDPVKIDRLLVPYCFSSNRALLVPVVLRLMELFSIQAHVISRDLHFFGRNHFHESVFKALCRKASTIQTSGALILLRILNFTGKTV